VTLGFGEIVYVIARNGDNPRTGFNLDERPERDHADRRAGVGQPLSDLTTVYLRTT
jgi:hypothetical protein